MADVDAHVDERVVEIETTRQQGKRIPFRIGGQVYRFRVPKLYGLVDTVKQVQASRAGDGMTDVAMFDKIERWLFDCLDEDDAEELQARLRDPDDEVDVEHLIEVFQHLTKEASGRPSGRRRSG